MDLVLTRTACRPDGIFGELKDESGHLIAYTIEHSYGEGDAWAAKVPAGEYVCLRGNHELHSGPIETFEVTGVPGHQGILIHPGNTEAASEGCILVGESICAGACQMITHSRATFARLMEMQAGVDEFRLTVQG